MHLTTNPIMPYPPNNPPMSLMKSPRGQGGLMYRRRSTVQILGAVVFVILLLGLVVHEHKQWRRSPRSVEQSGDKGDEPPMCAPKPYKRILLWTTFWEGYSDKWEKIFFRQVSHQCPVSSCELVYDRRNFDTADAVVIHLIDFLNTTELPTTRPAEQPWILFTLEAPPSVSIVPVDYPRLNWAINWTMTYRRDSDIVVPYGRVIPNHRLQGKDDDDVETQIEYPFTHESSGKKVIPDRDYWAEKSPDRMVAWMVSHCATDGRREWFVKELVHHTKVNVYGRCGFKKCGRNISIRTLGSFDQEACNQEISSHYFYLAFENAICEDYVTEKFFLALSLNVIPVVFGGADYETIAPPRSFINALEFKSPLALAKALNAIARNRTLYNSFFEWKKDFTVELGHPFLPMVCDLCAKLHGAPVTTPKIKKDIDLSHDGLKTKVVGRDPISGSYSDIEAWFTTGSFCRRWWAGPSDYRKHQKTGEGPQPKELDIVSLVEDEEAEKAAAAAAADAGDAAV